MSLKNEERKQPFHKDVIIYHTLLQQLQKTGGENAKKYRNFLQNSGKREITHISTR